MAAGQISSIYVIPADDIVGLTDYDILTVKEIRGTLIILHILGAIYLIGNKNPNPSSPYALGVVYVIVPALFSTTWVSVFLAAYYLLNANDADVTKTFDGAELVNSLLSYVYAFVGILIATASFLTIRSFVKTKIRPAIFVKQLKLNPETETLKALRPVLDMYLNNFVTTFVTIILYFFQNTMWAQASSA